VSEGGATADRGGEEGEDSGDGSAVSESSVTQYMCAYEQRRGHAQGVARAQMDDAYLFGKLEDSLLLESVMTSRLRPHGGVVREDKGRWYSGGEETLRRIPQRCQREEVDGGVSGIMVAGAPVGPPTFVRGVVRGLVSKVISEMHQIKNALAFDNGQALFCLNRYCYASKLDHIIQMCYPSDLVGELGGLATFDSTYLHFAELAGRCELDEDASKFALRRFRLPGRHKGGQGRVRSGWLRCAAFVGGAMQSVPRWADNMSSSGEVQRQGFLPALAVAVGFTPGVFQDEDAEAPFEPLMQGSRLGRELTDAWAELQQAGGVTMADRAAWVAGSALAQRDDRVLVRPAALLSHPCHRRVQRLLTAEVEEEKAAALGREAGQCTRSFHVCALEEVDRFSGMFLSFWPSGLTRLSQPSFGNAWCKYFGLPCPYSKGVLGRQLVRDGVPLTEGNRDSARPLIVDKWGSKLTCTALDGGWTVQHSAFQAAVIRWTKWVDGQATQELENLFLVSLPQQVVTEWRADQQRSAAHTADANAQLRGAQPHLPRGQQRAQARAAHRRDAARRGVVVDLQVKLATWVEAILFEVKTLHYSDRSTTPGAGAGTYGARPRERAASGAANRRARAVPIDRVRDAQRLDRELWPDRQQMGTGPIERRLRELGGVKALVVGAFAEHSADVHTLVDGLAEAAIPRTSHHYLVDPSKAKGAAKTLLYAAFGAAAWNAQSALLQSRLSFAGAPAVESPAGASSAGISDVARLEIHTQAALQNTSFNDT